MHPRHALMFVVSTVLIDIIGFGIIMPVLPQLLVEITGEPLAEASRVSGYLLVVFAVMQLVSAPLLGGLSDRYGRRPVLLISLVVYGINYLIMGFATTLWLLFLGRVLTGAAGATLATARAFIADVSPPGQRAQNFGLLGVAFGVGFIIGPVLGGLLGEIGPRAPFLAAAGLALANVVYGLFAMPETLAKADRRPFSLARANPVGAIIELRRHPLVASIAGAILFYNIGHQVYPSSWSFYTIEKFGWSPAQVGYSLAAVGIMSALVQGGLIRWFIPRFGAPRAAFTGLGCAALAYAGVALAPNAIGLYVAILISGFGGLAMPALQSIMADQVPSNQQGELQGALASLSSLASIIGPLAMTQTFAAFTSGDAPIRFPGAPFLLACLLTLVTLGLILPAIGNQLFRSAPQAP